MPVLLYATLGLFAAILPAADKPKGVDWSWPGRIMPAKSGWREGTRHSDFGFFRPKSKSDKVGLSGYPRCMGESACKHLRRASTGKKNKSC
jgi:hypothetical protein